MALMSERVFDKWKTRRSPTWSPDGKRIAYSYGQIGNSIPYILAQLMEKMKSVWRSAIRRHGLPMAQKSSFAAAHWTNRDASVYSTSKRTDLSSSLSPRNQSGFGVPHGLRLAINSPFLGIIALRFGWKTSEYQRSIL